MPYKIISVAMPPSDDQHPLDRHGIKLALRPIDNAPVVMSSDFPEVVDHDVLVSVNGTNLHNVEGGVPRIEEIFKECQKSEMKIVIHRVDEVPPTMPIQCNVIDQNTGSQCKKKIHRGHNWFRVCSRHNPQMLCSFVIDTNTQTKCTKIAHTGGFCCSHNPNKKMCSFVYANTKKPCTNLARCDGLLCYSHHPDYKCSFVYDEGTGIKCPNIALSRHGLCHGHGGNDGNQCQNEVDNKRCIRNRCINSQFCASCTSGNKCQVDGCDNDVKFGGCCEEHSGQCPQNFIIEYMEQKLDDLKANMNEKDYKLLEAIHNLRKTIKDDPFQDNSYSIDEEILKIVDKLMEEFRSDDKYKDKWVMDSNNECYPLLKHVHTRLVWILKAAIRDWRDNVHCILPIELMKKIADKVFEFFKSLIMSYHDEISTLVFKIGSGDADTRPFCANTYPPTVFQRDLRTDFGLQLPPDQRWKGERFGIEFGLGFIKCSNINLPSSMIPYTDACERASLYMVASRSSSLVRHVSDYAIDRHGIHLPPGYEMVCRSQSSSSNSGDATEIASTHIVGSNTASSASTTNSMPSNGEAATSSSPHHYAPLVNRESTLVGLNDKVSRHVASYLPELGQILFSMAVGRKLQGMLTRQHNEEGCVVDFGTDEDLAAKIRDGDLKQILRHIGNSVWVKKLMLTHCTHITGEGLAPLQGSEHIELIDLRVIADNDGRDDDVKLSCSAVVPILHSIVDTPNNSVQDFYFPSKWHTISSESFHRLLEQYRKMKAAVYNGGGDYDNDDEYYDFDVEAGVGIETVDKDVSRKRIHSSDAHDVFTGAKLRMMQAITTKASAHGDLAKAQGDLAKAQEALVKAQLESLHTPSTSSAIVTRVQKRARAMALGEDTTPNTKKMSKMVYRGIVRNDSAVRETILDCEEDIPSSQDVVTAVGQLLFED